MKILKKITASVLVSLISGIANAEVVFSHNGDSIFYDKSNNHYVIRYIGDDSQLHEVIWVPPNDVNYVLEESFHSSKDINIRYDYKIKVDKTSRLPIDGFKLYGINISKPFKSPKNWKGILRNSFKENDPGQWMNWYTVSSSLKPHKKISGFSISAMALPVYAKAYSIGETETIRYIDYGPSTEIQEYFEEKVVASRVNGKSVLTAVPLIPISLPYNQIETYTSFHKFLLGYIEKGYIPSTTANSMSIVSEGVLSALTSNSHDAAKSQLKELHKLIEGNDKASKSKSNPQLIDKTLRKILRFDIKFFLKQLDKS